MQLPLTVRPRPSRLLIAVLIVAHGLTLLGVVLTPMPMSLKLLAALLLVAALASSIVGSAGRRSIRALTLRSDGSLAVERRDGTQVEAQISPLTTVFP